MTTHHLAPGLRKNGAIHLFPLHAFMTWTRKKLYFHFILVSGKVETSLNELGSPELDISLTLRLLMSYIYGAPSKARNSNVVYIWTYVWQR